MLTEQEFYITDKILQRSINIPEEKEFDLYILRETSSNPDMIWVLETLEEKQYENINLIVSAMGKKDEFVLNLYYHLIYLAKDYELTGLEWPNSLELAQRDIEELLAVYNLKDVELN